MRIYGFLILFVLVFYLILSTIVPNLGVVYFWFYELVIFSLLFIFIFKCKSKNLIIAISFFVFCATYNIFERYIIFANTNFSKLIHFLLVISGIFFILKENKEKQSELTKLRKENLELAFYNPLTNLPNRNYFLKTLTNYWDNKRCEKVAGLFLDIDNFKLINDILGQDIGDMVLTITSERIKTQLNKDDLLIHMSSDEFLILIYDVVNIEAITDKIISEISKPYFVNDKKINITVSIGISIYPEHGTDLNTLLKRADIALTEAKKLGKSQYFIFKSSMEQLFNKHYLLLDELRTAIINKDFIVYYQPIAQIEDNKITSLEALVRWEHKEHGIIYPNDFIPLAEEVGLIEEIDYIVLEIVCKQIASWTKDKKKPYDISVNISPKFLKNPNFITKLDDLLKSYHISTENLRIEITENIALTNINKTKDIINKLKERKIKISIDDFGKGYSTLSYLKEFNFDYLKIDKTFIDKIPENITDSEIIRLILNLSKIFNFKIICEGVEKIEQLEFLKNNGCHEYQGYLLSKPKPLEQLNLDFSNNE